MRIESINPIVNESGDVVNTPVKIEIDSISEIRFVANYRDVTDPKKPIPGIYREENTNLNFNEQAEGELNRVLSGKKFLIAVAKAIAVHVVSGIDPGNVLAKELKTAVNLAVSKAIEKKK